MVKLNSAIALILATALPAVAQTSPTTVKTLRVESTATPLFRVDDDGKVKIDWHRVEAAADSANLAQRDVARALIALRDGKAQAMQ